MYSSSAEPEVLFETKNNRGIITLNKPKALNSINHSMVVSIINKLQDWEDCMDLVIMKGAGGKAFCAGGDVVEIAKLGPSCSAQGKKFFRTEYAMDNLIGTYKKPYVALIDGITMGGGVGMSVHGKYRVASEKTLFAMPETAIGLIPDVGGGYFLPRLKGQLGQFLALTGYRLKGTDVVRAGIATHFCDSEHIPELLNALVTSNAPLEDVFSKFTRDVSSIPFSLDSKMDEIDRIFSKPTVEEIFEELEKSGSPWALETLATLKRMSPFSLKLSKRQLEKGKLMSLQEVLQMENRIAGACLEGRVSLDFFEGKLFGPKIF